VVTSVRNRRTSWILHPSGPRHRFSVVLCVKMSKNDDMQGFCSWFSLAKGVSAVKLSFMYSREWSQVRETEEHLGYYIRLARDNGFRWFYMSKCVKMMSWKVSVAGPRLRRFVWLSNSVLCIVERGHKCKDSRKTS